MTSESYLLARKPDLIVRRTYPVSTFLLLWLTAETRSLSRNDAPCKSTSPSKTSKYPTQKTTICRMALIPTRCINSGYLTLLSTMGVYGTYEIA